MADVLLGWEMFIHQNYLGRSNLKSIRMAPFESFCRISALETLRSRNQAFRVCVQKLARYCVVFVKGP